MKHLKPFDQFLLEAADVGKKLFADPADPDLAGWGWQEYLTAMYKDDFEPNTEYERIVINHMRDYFKDPELLEADLAKLLKELLPLKKKFPKLLDPSTAQFDRDHKGHYSEKYPGYVWRGTVMPENNILKLLPTATLHINKYSNLERYFFVIDDANYVYTSKGNRGFLSFSQDPTVAQNFRGRTNKKMYSTVFGVNSTNTNMLVSPEFSNSLSDYEEYETLYVGNKLKPDVIVVNDIMIKDKFQLDLSNWRYQNNIEKNDQTVLAFFDQWKREKHNFK